MPLCIASLGTGVICNVSAKCCCCISFLCMLFESELLLFALEKALNGLTCTCFQPIGNSGILTFTVEHVGLWSDSPGTMMCMVDP